MDISDPVALTLVKACEVVSGLYLNLNEVTISQSKH